MPDDTTTAPDLGAFAGMDFGFEEDATTPAGEEPAADDTTDEEAEQAEDADEEGADDDEQAEGEAEATPEGKPHNPDGPGNVKAALRQAREAEKAAKVRAEQAEQQLAAIQQQRNAVAQQQREAQERAFIQQRINEMDPDDVPAYLEQVQQHQAQRLKAEAQETQAWDRLVQSETFARASFSDYDTQIAKLTAIFGVQTVANWALSQDVPANAAYQAAKGLYTQSDIDAAKAAGRSEALAEIAGRSNARKPSASPRVGAIPPVAKTPDRDPAGRFSKQLATGGNVSEAVAGMFARVVKG